MTESESGQRQRSHFFDWMRKLRELNFNDLHRLKFFLLQLYVN